MKIAITGGTGFVGRHLARALVVEGHELALISAGWMMSISWRKALPAVRPSFIALASTVNSESKPTGACISKAHETQLLPLIEPAFER